MSKKSAMIRTAAATAATVLMTVGAMGPALADHDGGKGASQDDHAKTATSGRTDRADRTDKTGKADKGHQSQGHRDEKTTSNNGRGDERGNGHTPVTVCHLLGNGSYNVLTFDDNALEAHVNHGDLYPVPADGCPASSEDVKPATFHGTPGHVRVTVCHLLGNGGYHELTFDEHALPAHEAHGDLYPVPAAGCPTEAPEETVPGTTPEGEDTPGDDTPADDTTPAEVLPGDDTTADHTPVESDAVVAGVEERDTTSANDDAEVLGVEAFAGANRAAPVTGPLAGILPQTGAGQLGLAAAAGVILLGAGATMVARRRTQGA